MEAIPIVFFWAIAFWSFFQSKHILVYLLIASMPFGSFAVIPTALTAGLTLTPTPVVALFLIAKELGSADGLSFALDSALKASRLLLLFLFWLVACLTTAFMPRFFAGQVEIIPVRAEINLEPALLIPTTQNFSQFIYISISILTVFALSRRLKNNAMRRHIIYAFCVGSILTVLTGLLDFLSQYLPMDSILEIFRTASYGLVIADEVLGGKRVVGLMPEASAFGSLSLAFLTSLYFFRHALSQGAVRNYVIPVLIFFLILMIWMSTSSAAYLGLGVFLIAAIAEWVWRVLTAKNNPYMRLSRVNELIFGVSLLTLITLVYILSPKTFAPVEEMLDVMVFQKTNSSSFEERSSWTKISWQALLTTNGLGVGLGGTRASNFLVVLFSSVGFVGGGLYICFLIQCLLIRRAPTVDFEAQSLLSAIRWSFLPPFFASLTIGTTPDFGIFNALLLGFSVALVNGTRKHGTRIVLSNPNVRPLLPEARTISTSLDLKK